MTHQFRRPPIDRRRDPMLLVDAALVVGCVLLAFGLWLRIWGLL